MDEDLGDFSLACNTLDIGTVILNNYFVLLKSILMDGHLKNIVDQNIFETQKIRRCWWKIKKVVEFHEFKPEEKNNIRTTYYKNYDNILKYQNEIILFMRNLCEILEFMSEKNSSFGSETGKYNGY